MGFGFSRRIEVSSVDMTDRSARATARVTVKATKKVVGVVKAASRAVAGRWQQDCSIAEAFRLLETIQTGKLSLSEEEQQWLLVDSIAQNLGDVGATLRQHCCKALSDVKQRQLAAQATDEVAAVVEASPHQEQIAVVAATLTTKAKAKAKRAKAKIRKAQSKLTDVAVQLNGLLRQGAATA